MAPGELVIILQISSLFGLQQSVKGTCFRGNFYSCFFGSVKELKESQSSFVRPFGPSLSRAPNLHLSGLGLSQVTLRALLGLS